jgi:hypothetical protein
MSKFTLSIQQMAPMGRAIVACAALGCTFLACSDSDDDSNEDSTTEANQPGADLSFFVTSSTQDGNLGGLAGADATCERLATAVGAGDKTWRAYLSAENGGTPIHARERIGTGPWMNAMGMMIAANLTALHAPTLVGNADLFITEEGEKVNGQWNSSNGMNGAPVNEHDIMTGSDSSGMLIMTGTTTCADWTSNTLTPGPQVGHTDGMGPGMDATMPNFTSWNGGHAAAGCSAADLAARGGAGRFYCFAAN